MNVKFIIVLFGIATMLGCSITLFITFMAAYFNNFEIMVVINSYGEAHMELFLLMITFPMTFWATVILLKAFAKNSLKKCEEKL